MTDDARPFVVSAPEGGVPAMMAHASVAAQTASWRDDYAWTNSAGVEGFFFVLTIVVVPVAAVRWTRRLRQVARGAADRPGSARS